MQLLFKIVFSVFVILTATALARKFPSLAGLIAVMPLAGALVLVWVYWENRGNAQVMQAFAKGALWGILPSILFYLVAFLCFRKQASLFVVLVASFGVWGMGALVHQWLVK